LDHRVTNPDHPPEKTCQPSKEIEADVEIHAQSLPAIDRHSDSNFPVLLMENEE